MPWPNICKTSDSGTIHTAIFFCRQNKIIQEETDEDAKEEDSEYDVTDEEEDSEPVR